MKKQDNGNWEEAIVVLTIGLVWVWGILVIARFIIKGVEGF